MTSGELSVEVNLFMNSEEKLSNELLEGIEKMFGQHAGLRPLHAKGMLCSGTFQPAASAAALTRAPHVAGADLKAVVRFSNSTGIPNIPDNDPNANPRGIGIRFYLAEHVHTDIIGHSHNGFPTRTGEEFLEMIQAIATSGADTAHPTPVEKFMSTHPAALRFVQTPHLSPTSFAGETFFAVTAFKFTNKEGESKFGRFQIHPEIKGEHLTEEEAKTKGPDFLFDELEARLQKEPVRLRITVQIAKEGDNVNDSTVSWPDDREQIEFGTVILTEKVSDEDPEAKRLIFDPIPRVDGIDPSEDPLIELRSALYLISGRRRRAAAAK